MTSDIGQFLSLLQSSLEPGFKPEFLQRDHTVFQFCFPDALDFYLEVDSASFSLHEGQHKTPTLTLWLDQWQTCLRLLTGEENGMNAFMEGRYRADGNIVLSQLLLYLFKIKNSPSIYEVQD